MLEQTINNSGRGEQTLCKPVRSRQPLSLTSYPDPLRRIRVSSRRQFRDDESATPMCALNIHRVNTLPQGYVTPHTPKNPSVPLPIIMT